MKSLSQCAHWQTKKKRQNTGHNQFGDGEQDIRHCFAAI